MLAAGDYEGAALSAAKITDPTAYRKAMERCFEARSRTPHFPTAKGNSVLQFTKHPMRLSSLNVRRELAKPAYTMHRQVVIAGRIGAGRCKASRMPWRSSGEARESYAMSRITLMLASPCCSGRGL